MTISHGLADKRKNFALLLLPAPGHGQPLWRHVDYPECCAHYVAKDITPVDVVLIQGSVARY